jgi:hypothetical protein
MGLIYRFTLIHSSKTQIISEPIGWDEIKVILDRDAEYFGLVELFEVSLTFYGDNGTHDGGLNFIDTILRNYGINETITMRIQVSEDGVEFDLLCEYILNLESYKRIDNRKATCGLLRDGAWSRFVNREDTPVDIQSTESLSGQSVIPAEPMTLRLPSQKLRQQYAGHLDRSAGYPGTGAIIIETNNRYVQFDWNIDDISEVKEKFWLPITDNPSKPANIFELEFAGTVRVQATIDIRNHGGPSNTDRPSTFMDVYIQFDSNTPIAFSTFDFSGTPFLFPVTRFTIDEEYEFKEPGGKITIYGDRHNTDYSIRVMYQEFNNTNQVQVLNNITVTHDTVFPETETDGFFIHDLGDAILQRIADRPLYSEFLGAEFTRSRQYAEMGCGSNHVAAKGLHVRGYSLMDKKFFESFKNFWNGINPVFNLSMFDDVVNNEPVYRIEPKSYVLNDTPSLYLNWVNNIEQSFDKNVIFKEINVGYNKWQSEDIRGLDDPQTKSVFTTVFEFIGTKLNILSTYIAASLAIEVTRRKSILKSADYKFDNDTFLIAVNPSPDGSPASPETYIPELDENFASTSNLLHAESRYNLFLTPIRNLLRWANYINGALLKYLTTSYKFASGEGNYDFASQYDCSDGLKKDCEGTVCSNISESGNIDLATHGATLGHLFTPETYDFEHPLTWEEYKTIRENRHHAIAVSTTDANHDICFIKRLEYDLHLSKAKFTVWKK